MTQPGHIVYALVHILGSTEGYRTIYSSPDISELDRATLETLGFGQADSPDYYSQLALTPAAMGRPLPSGRYAVTRVLAGPLDTAGRYTMLFVSLVFESSAWSSTVAGSLKSLLADHRQWTSALTQPAALEVDLTESFFDSDERMWAMAAAETFVERAGSRRLIVLPDDRGPRGGILAVPAILSPVERHSIRWGLGVLAASAPVDICTMVVGGDRSARRSLHYLDAPFAPKTQEMNMIARCWGTSALPSACSVASAWHKKRSDASPRPPRAEKSHQCLRTQLLVCGAVFTLLSAGVLMWRVMARAPLYDPKGLMPGSQIIGDISPSQADPDPGERSGTSDARAIAGNSATNLMLDRYFRERESWLLLDLQHWLAEARRAAKPNISEDDRELRAAISQAEQAVYWHESASGMVSDIVGRLECFASVQREHAGLSLEEWQSMSAIRDQLRELASNPSVAEFLNLRNTTLASATHTADEIILRHESQLKRVVVLHAEQLSDAFLAYIGAPSAINTTSSAHDLVRRRESQRADRELLDWALQHQGEAIIKLRNAANLLREHRPASLRFDGPILRACTGASAAAVRWPGAASNEPSAQPQASADSMTASRAGGVVHQASELDRVIQGLGDVRARIESATHLRHDDIRGAKSALAIAIPIYLDVHRSKPNSEISRLSTVRDEVKRLLSAMENRVSRNLTSEDALREVEAFIDDTIALCGDESVLRPFSGPLTSMKKRIEQRGAPK